MSESKSEQTPTVEDTEKHVATSEDTPTPSDRETDWEAEAERWKKFSRQHEARAKELAEKAEAYDQLRETRKSEEEKQAERIANLEARLNESERQRIATEYNVPVELVAAGDTESMEATAKALSEWRSSGPSPSGSDAAGTQGEPIGSGQLTRADMAKMSAEAIEEARKAGRFDHLLGGQV